MSEVAEIQKKVSTAISENPWPAVGIAAAAGALISPRLVVGLVLSVLRIAFHLVKPALLGLAIWKLVDWQKKTRP